jgi:hypothetical protein
VGSSRFSDGALPFWLLRSGRNDVDEMPGTEEYGKYPESDDDALL